MKTTFPRRGLRVASFALLMVLTGAGCGKKAPPRSEADAPWEVRAADQTYSVRGRVEGLPGPGQALRIYHEPIPDFVNGRGETVGMKAMVMEFPHLLPGLDIEAIEVGDIIEFDFDVYWTNGTPAWRVTSLYPLDPDTPLDLQAGSTGEPPPGGIIVHRYDVRGEIAQLPDPERPMRELLIRHEAIPTFRNVEDKAVGMRAMTMPFPSLDEGVTLDGLEIGTKVRFTLRTEVRDGRLRYWIEELETLPAETELDFGGG